MSSVTLSVNTFPSTTSALEIEKGVIIKPITDSAIDPNIESTINSDIDLIIESMINQIVTPKVETQIDIIPEPGIESIIESSIETDFVIITVE
jgi:hypothetical protein